MKNVRIEPLEQVAPKYESLMNPASAPGNPAQRVRARTRAEDAVVMAGYFNKCEHLHVEIEPGRDQTISCRLPNGKFVTFAFLGREGSTEMESVDIHSTSLPTFSNDEGSQAFNHHLIGFHPGGRTSFDTRQMPKKTSLATLLLNPTHYEEKG